MVLVLKAQLPCGILAAALADFLAFFLAFLPLGALVAVEGANEEAVFGVANEMLAPAANENEEVPILEGKDLS